MASRSMSAGASAGTPEGISSVDVGAVGSVTRPTLSLCRGRVGRPAAWGSVMASVGSRPSLSIVPLENVTSNSQTSPLLALSTSSVDRERIEAAMHAAVVTPDDYLTEIASHLIVAGGKRLRPVLATVAAQIGGEAASDDVVRGGVSCELVHLGSLYHDDVMDEADTRRGVETVNAKWGNLQAILAGDFLLSRASEIAASLGTEVAGLLARTIGWLCEGQIEELRFTYDVARTEASYYASIHGKTASLYGTAARIGGIVAGRDCELETRGRRFGGEYTFDPAEDAGAGARRGENCQRDDGREELPHGRKG